MDKPQHFRQEQQPHGERKAPPHILDRHTQCGAGLVLDNRAEEKFGSVEGNPAHQAAGEQPRDYLHDLTGNAGEFAGEQLHLGQGPLIGSHIAAQKRYENEHVRRQLIRPGQGMVKNISHKGGHKDQNDLNAKNCGQKIFQDINQKIICRIQGIENFFNNITLP